ncbi:methylthioribulose 1-phosphate dehydratase [Bacillus sonorensis]|nr:methylthioribulose 1-phosphate dehydratase [Bacillus sonorensis]
MDAGKKRWQELAEVKRELAARDWFPATSGNLSIKVSDDPLRFFVTASGKDKRKETDEDFLLVDEEGMLDGKRSYPEAVGRNASSYVCLQKNKCCCCLHVHTIDNNVISELYGQEKQVSFRGQEIIKALGYWEENAEVTVPIIENTAHIPDLAADFAAHLTKDSGAVLIRSHGITVWGRTAFEAKRMLEAYEFLFSWHLKLKSYQTQYA